MNRSEAIEIVVNALGEKELLVAANGLISRDLAALKDAPRNFYMLGSMGLGSSIGLGIALSLPNRKVTVLDGDGNILMNLGSLATIGSLAPKNLIHVVLDNESHESTGGQPTAARTTKIDKVAEASGFRITEKVYDAQTLKKVLKNSLKCQGPSLILVKIERSDSVAPRVLYEPVEIRERFKIMSTIRRLR